MRHPGMRDIGDVAARLFPWRGISPAAREIANAMLIINSIFGMGYHVATGGKSEWPAYHCRGLTKCVTFGNPSDGSIEGVPIDPVGEVD